ncbi:beta-ketoacyl-ACP synthase II [Acidimicrobiia bacterium]|jgi:3-oxoacyl-[acyl-carrier-protein] synthase II|nr:beta-ketoacyl-ACP synthase II [Acidimicrobiia bacterium]MDA9275573.1 beta-ketoacyl-ACP synthase II [Acidimicrobiia bacterium]|tara:strand:- start:3482 stop:4720 length:1239 start_codon:yes stop_codon:yes gene_type:complete
MSNRRVVITGFGTINPLANNVSDTWNKLINGESGIEKITAFDTSELPVSFAGEVKNFDANEYMGKQNARKLDRSSHLSIFATEEALKDAGLNSEERLGPNVGIVFGTGIGGIGSTEQAVRTFDERGASRISPLAITQLMPNSSTGQVAIKYGIEGPSLTITTACAASANAVGEAKNMIQNGIVDMVIAGGIESGTTAMTIGAFAQIRALSTNNENPQEACRPFDKDRDGFVMGEGSTVLVMESEESAIKRGAQIYGYVAGYGASTDAFHITAPAEGGKGAVDAMQKAIKDANLAINDIEYINAHGTSTPANDKNETAAIKTVFGEQAYELDISSTKSMTGHLLGGGGAFESMVSVLALKNGIVPPTINLKNLDEDCDLKYTPNTALNKTLNVAMSNSFGFGGHNGVLVFKKD